MNLPRQAIRDGIYANCLDGSKFKVHAITIGIDVPLDIKSVTYANLLSRVLKRGCSKYPDMKEIEKKLDDLFGADISFAVSRSGESEFFFVFTDFLSDNYTEGLDIISEIVDLTKELLFFPKTENNAFDENYVEVEKKNLADDIDAQINNKAKYARNRLVGELCKNEPYSLPITGDKDILEKVTAGELLSFFRELLLHSRIEILYTGEPSQFQKVCDCLKNAFSTLSREYTPVSHSMTITPKTGSVREVFEEMEVNQGKLSMGFVTNITNTSDDIGALVVANEIFGGSPNSKLFMNVREKMSLCYYCSSSVDAVKGIMLVNAGIESENYETTKNAINEQLDDLKAGKFTDEEFDNAISSLTNGYKSVTDSVSSLEAWYLPRIFRGEDTTPESRIMQIKAVKREDVILAANKISPEVVYFLKPQDNKEVER